MKRGERMIVVWAWWTCALAGGSFAVVLALVVFGMVPDIAWSRS